MRPEEIVRSGPNQYICREEVLKDLSYFINDYRSPVVVTGYKSYAAFQKYANLPSHVEVYQHNGYSSDESIRDISQFASQADIIIGIGGGIILDTAKSVADKLGIEIITIPTVVGTCAAATPLSVIYDDNGAFVRVDYHASTIHLTLVDPLFLLSSPIDYFKSGIGDSLAKWYEAEAIIRNDKNGDLSIMVKVGLEHASYIKDILLEDSIAAIENMDARVITTSFIKVVEAVIPLAGTVGGFGGHYGRMSGAHAVHNGLSFIDETHSILHGQKVAYGILVQLLLENRTEEVKDLLPFYKSLGLPVYMEDLNIMKEQNQAMKTVASHAIKPEETLRLVGSFHENDVIEAMEKLENI
ncbi:MULTISPECIES: iron-containing alcohol dehydrogenase family protein [Paraliobacillus]|uniref:iron-containing alcohol dehydrogenase family protein n=1 Tax=Paraliobacillus TaxID=200903 RepID=UPI000DD31BC3|nr:MULTISPECIES: iron-containing alcohol dehydrogenase family protein [Paraliobacillus]